MADTLIITFIAEDRPGVVEQLSEVVEANGGNWLESRMAHLAETFAGVARV
jgi:glycine cleavage system regulatory protein